MDDFDQRFHDLEQRHSSLKQEHDLIKQEKDRISGNYKYIYSYDYILSLISYCSRQ